MKNKEIIANIEYKGKETEQDIEKLVNGSYCVTHWNLFKRRPHFCSEGNGQEHCRECFNNEYKQ